MKVDTNISFYGPSKMTTELGDSTRIHGNNGGDEKAGFTLRLTVEDAEALKLQLEELLATHYDEAV